MGCRAVTWGDLERYHYPSDRSIQVVKQKEGASLGQVDLGRAGRVSREALERAYKPATRREIRFVKLLSRMQHAGVGTVPILSMHLAHITDRQALCLLVYSGFKTYYAAWRSATNQTVQWSAVHEGGI